MLKRVSIQNFKSLKDVTLDLQKVNLLIGPNNSGKTNFLKALGKCDALVRGSTDVNYDEIFRKEGITKLSLRLIFDEKPFEEIQGNYTHLIYRYITGPYGRNNYELYYGISEEVDSEIERTDFPTLRNRMHEFFGIGAIYKPDPNKLTQPGPVGTGEEFVNADASNLVGFLDRILGKYKKTVFSRIETDLQMCIPEFNEVILDDASPTEELKAKFPNRSFKQLGLTDGYQNVQYWADELSEGTLYFLALLCIINQPNPPKLLLLEEPEKGIHPRRIREVMDFIFRLAEEKDIQIILTTHNENILNEFTSMPEAVFVFEKDEEGATHVKNLLKDIIEPSHQLSRETGTKEIDFTSNLGENWMYGLLGGVPQETI